MNLPFQIIIMDDEAHARGFVRNMLLQYCPGTVVAGEADGVAAAVGLLRETKAGPAPARRGNVRWHRV